jgi:threonine dehydrogenase-like Zn-dependent dehydrogenase
MIIGLSDRDASITPGILLSKELRVDASIAYHHTEFERAMAMIVDGRVRADLSTRKVGFAGLEDAIAELAAGDAKDAKILFDPRAG